MPNIDLYIPDTKAFNALREKLEYHNNKDSLQALAEIFLDAFGQRPIVFWNHDKVATTPPYVKGLMTSKNQIKLVYTQFCAMMICEKRNMQAFFSLLPESHVNALKELLLKHYMTLDELQKKHGISLKKKSNNYGWRSYSELDLPFVECIYSGHDEKWNYLYNVRIQEGMREFVYEPLLPGMSQYEAIETLPHNVHAFDNELSTLQVLPVVEALIEQGILDFNGSRFTPASIKKAAKQLGAKDFFTHPSFPKEMMSIRNSFLLQAAGFVEKKTKRSKAPNNTEDTIKHIIRNMLSLTQQTYPMVMNYITGLRPASYGNCYGSSIISQLVSCLKTLPRNRWTTVDSFIRHAYESNAHHYTLAFFYRSNSTATFTNKFSRVEHPIDYFKQISEMGIPYVKGLLFMLASWGVLDIGCRDYRLDDISPYDTLLYIRLTHLGEYVFNLSPTYKAPAKKADEVFFELDPERLIIRSIADNNPYENLLTDTCISIGNRRYRMNEETFLSHCKTRHDVEQKIDFFKRYISGELGPLWEEFFDSLLKRCKPLTALESNKYHIFSISPDNRTLVKLLASDPILQKIIIKAENYVILVENSNYVSFVNRLKSLGYLI